MLPRPPPIWFVTYLPLDRVPGQGHKRTAKQFATEQDAKEFAKARLLEDPDITAGSINPHLPKRFIGAAQIDEWLNEPGN